MRPTTNGLNVSETERWRLAADPARLQTFAGNPAARRTPGQPARRQRSVSLKFRPLHPIDVFDYLRAGGDSSTVNSVRKPAPRTGFPAAPDCSLLSQQSHAD